MRPMYQNGTFVLMSTGGLRQAEWSPCTYIWSFAVHRSSCGRRNADGISVRIVGADDDASQTQFGEWPHTCAVSERGRNGKWQFVAGASLIDEGIVLTAAHKIE